MFKNKQTQLFSVPSVPVKSVNAPKNQFIASALRKSVETTSGNGGLKLNSTLDPFVDQFGKLGTYKAPRPFADIERDCELLWAEDKLNAVKFIGYLRTITRKVRLPDGYVTDEPQKGGELKHEPLMRMLWLSQKAPDAFWHNIGLFVSLGSWHDIFALLQYDLVYNGWDGRVLNWDRMGDLILTALNSDSTCNLVQKYLPHIKSRSACKTVESQANCMIGKWVCSLIFGPKDSSSNYKSYRKLKASGNAHTWQQLISKREFEKIKFDSIHGRALNLLVRSKFLKNQNLSEKYKAWVGDPKTKVKYTGFVHELFGNLPYSLSSLDTATQDTINKQFATLVEKAKSEKAEKACNFIVVRDTSGSMASQATGTTQSCFNIGKALALYFSEFLSGPFADNFIEFNRNAMLHTWKGNTPLEKWFNDDCDTVGNTNFQSVIDLFVALKATGIAESDFPTGILAISDSEFDPSELDATNVETARKKLRNGGFSEDFANNFQIVLWNLQSRAYGRGTGEKFETTADTQGCYYFSGYSPSVITFLTEGRVETARDLFDAAMSQEILSRISV